MFWSPSPCLTGISTLGFISTRLTTWKLPLIFHLIPSVSNSHGSPALFQLIGPHHQPAVLLY